MKSPALFCSLTLSLMVMSCSSAPENSVSEPAAENALQPTEQRIVPHAMGETALPGEPQRVVMLTNEATDIALALGITPIGAVKSWTGEPYYDYIAEDMAGVPIVGDEQQPSLERIAALQPDLIIGSQVRQEPIYEQLSAIAPTVFSETIGETWQENLLLYGQALNREAKAEKLLAEWDARVAELREKWSDRNIQVSLVRFMPGAARIYLKDSFPGQILQEVGLQRPPSQDQQGFAQEVSLEQIPRMNGDVLFYFTYTGAGNNQSPDTVTNPWTSHPLWQQLDVVQSGQAYSVSDVVWTMAGGIQAAHLLLDDLERVVGE